MSVWRPEELRVGVGGSWLTRPPADAPDITGVSIDSRTIQPGEAFFALRGERFDGHEFLRDAVARGAALLVVEDRSAAAPERLGPGVPAVRVPDARAALIRLARVFRRSLDPARVVAVTGSNGKTTTVRLIDAALSAKLRGAASVKSFNNDVGVPLTILRARKGDQYLVCEVGMNHPGEIAALAALVEPDVAVITSIGRAHIEHLGSVEAIAREKASLLQFLRPGGLAVVPAAQPLLEERLKTVPNIVTFGADPSADLRVTRAEHARRPDGSAGLSFTINDRSTFEIPLVGAHNALNAAAAVAVARRLGLDEDAIRRGLAAAKAPEMRLQRRTVRGVDVVNDAYNSNPESAIAAVRAFAEIAADAARRVVVLGDMLEMGPHAPAGHREVAEAILQAGCIDMVITVGEASLHAAERLLREWPASRVVMLREVTEGGALRAAAVLREGDAVLLKGSRGMQLEKIEHALAGDHAASPARSGASHHAARTVV